jgi:hypothetical protein
METKNNLRAPEKIVRVLACLGGYMQGRMTLEAAVRILNREKHHGHSNWYISGELPSDSIVLGKDQYEFFEPFEAIAIAEKYDSDVSKVSARPTVLDR